MISHRGRGNIIGQSGGKFHAEARRARRDYFYISHGGHEDTEAVHSGKYHAEAGAMYCAPTLLMHCHLGGG